MSSAAELAANAPLKSLLLNFPSVGRFAILREVLRETLAERNFSKEKEFDMNPHIEIRECAEESVRKASLRGVETTREEILILWVSKLYV